MLQSKMFCTSVPLRTCPTHISYSYLKCNCSWFLILEESGKSAMLYIFRPRLLPAFLYATLYTRLYILCIYIYIHIYICDLIYMICHSLYLRSSKCLKLAANDKFPFFFFFSEYGRGSCPVKVLCYLHSKRKPATIIGYFIHIIKRMCNV